MSINVLNSFASSNVASRASRAHPSERVSAPKAATSGSALSDIAGAVAAGVSATVSFSGKALLAAESAGGVVAHSAEELAVGAWHALHVAAIRAEHGVKAGANEFEEGAGAVVGALQIVGKEAGHYAAVALDTLGEGLSEVSTGAVMAASAGGQMLRALL